MLPDPSVPKVPSVRGRYLPRHRARVVEHGDLLVVEFLEPASLDAPAPVRTPPMAQRRADVGSVVQVLSFWGLAVVVLVLSLLRLG